MMKKMMKKSLHINSIFHQNIYGLKLWEDPGGGGVLPYMDHIGMCRCEGYGFQAVYFRIGYINQNIWV